jgi:hypothetical protein
MQGFPAKAGEGKRVPNAKDGFPARYGVARRRVVASRPEPRPEGQFHAHRMPMPDRANRGVPKPPMSPRTPARDAVPPEPGDFARRSGRAAAIAQDLLYSGTVVSTLAATI